ncbi:oxidoreductase (plasmid) [Bacillus megaterium]|nr:oxidoreductase [Priestia megaterium]
MWSIFHNWGTRQKDGTIQDIQWTMRIKNVGKNKFRLTKIEETSNTVAGLAPVKEHYQKEAGVKVDDENNGYTIENRKLKVTYDNRKHWHTVPIKINELFGGEYNGQQDTLIPGSFVISPNKTAFVIVEKEQQIETGQPEPEKIKVVYSVNKGTTWKESSVPMTFPSVRIRMIGFTSKQNGYLIVTSDRTMNFESHVVFKTNNGGKSWKEVGSVPGVNSLVTDGGFINDRLGFISFGSKNEMDKQPSPYLFRTSDGGRTWGEVEVPIPSEYQGIFTVAQVPVFDGSQGTLLVNQGPSGDFQGGKVLARFISVDKGVTWNFANLVDPDQVLSN